MSQIEISANNDGLILPPGCELAIIQNGQVINQGNAVAQAAFDATADKCFERFEQIMGGLKKKRTPDTFPKRGW